MKKTALKTPRAMPALRQSAQSVWLAGLGALAMAGEEGGKLFQLLVKKGRLVEKDQKVRLAEVRSRAEGWREEAQEKMLRLRPPVGKTVTAAMHRLGVPTRGEILELTRRVEALTRAVDRKPAAAKRRPAARRSKAPEPAGVA